MRERKMEMGHARTVSKGIIIKFIKRPCLYKRTDFMAFLKRLICFFEWVVDVYKRDMRESGRW